jgi:hypothetical protein
MSTKYCTGIPAEFGYGSLLNSNSTANEYYIVEILNKNLYLLSNTLKNGQFQQSKIQVPSADYTCQANVPVTLQLVVYQGGGAALYINRKSTPSAIITDGSFTNQPVFLGMYTPASVTSFSNFSLSGATPNIMLPTPTPSIIPTPKSSVTVTPTPPYGCSYQWHCMGLLVPNGPTPAPCQPILYCPNSTPTITPTPPVGCYYKQTCLKLNCPVAVMNNGICPPSCSTALICQNPNPTPTAEPVQSNTYCGVSHACPANFTCGSCFRLPAQSQTMSQTELNRMCICVPNTPTPTPPLSSYKVCKTSADCTTNQMCTLVGPITANEAQVKHCYPTNMPLPL